MNNYEKIKSMNIDEMVKHHIKYVNSHIKALLMVIKKNTSIQIEKPLLDDEYAKDIKQWLMQEAEDE